jgi:hypothetical protein
MDNYCEPAVNTPVFLTGAHTALISCGLIHIAWFLEQPGVDGLERIINLRTIMPLGAVDPVRRIIDEARRAARDISRLDS